MLDGSMIDLWLEVSMKSGTQVVVPYARASVDAQAGYQVLVLREGSAGKSEIRQSGNVSLQPGVASPLGQVSVNRTPNDSCRVEIRLFEGVRQTVARDFDCP